MSNNVSNRQYVVVNKSFGDEFALSVTALRWLKNHGFNRTVGFWNKHRSHPTLVECILELEEDASPKGCYTNLRVEWFEGNYDYRIVNDLGYECVVRVPKASVVTTLCREDHVDELLCYLRAGECLGELCE